MAVTPDILLCFARLFASFLRCCHFRRAVMILHTAALPLFRLCQIIFHYFRAAVILLLVAITTFFSPRDRCCLMLTPADAYAAILITLIRRHIIDVKMITPLRRCHDMRLPL